MERQWTWDDYKVNGGIEEKITVGNRIRKVARRKSREKQIPGSARHDGLGQ